MSDSKDKDKDKNKGKTKNKDKDDNDKEKDRDENKDKEKDKDQKEDKEKDKNKLKEKENEKDKEQERSGSGVFSHFVDAVVLSKSRERGSSTFSEDFKLYKGSYVSLGSPEIITISLETGEMNRYRQYAKDDQVGTQRVYKKTSPNSQLTLYLPTRELVSTGNQPAILRGILHADPKNVQGYRLYAQLTLTFRYGREDEEVMGLRFCNEAIMCLNQLWPQNEDLPKETLTPLQEALIKRLGNGAYPFTLSLTPQAPPSVQLVPAKRYYGAPIGTSYEVRCFIADKTDEKFHRRATVRMGIRVIHRTDVFSSTSGPENFASIINNQLSPPPPHDVIITKQASEPIPNSGTNIENLTPTSKSLSTITAAATSTHVTATTANTISTTAATITSVSSNTTTITTPPPPLPTNQITSPTASTVPATTTTTTPTTQSVIPCKHKKSERVDSFPKIRLSPKSFRFSSRFGRSKSEAEKAPNDPFYSYSKSFQDYDTCGGPQGSVDKPFLLQEGRVCLKASLDKAWYTHGEDVIVTINIKNDSRKTVRKVRVCAIQHVDVCMFNNGKFKNVVADSDITSPGERTVGPGGSLNATVILKPQRGPTKNWIALEDSLQRSCEPDEITGAIAASAVRTPTIYSLTAGTGGGVGGNVSGCGAVNTGSTGTSPEDRNVFAIYVSYYVKVKLTLSGMGGELSLKLPFALVHVDSSNKSPKTEMIELTSNRLSITDNQNKPISTTAASIVNKTSNISSLTPEKNLSSSHCIQNINDSKILDKIESIDDDVQLHSLNKITTKRKLIRHETLAKDDSSDEGEKDDIQTVQLEQAAVHHHHHHHHEHYDSHEQFNTKTSLTDTKEDDSVNEPKNNLQQTSPSSPLSTSPSINKQTTCVQIHSSLS